MPPHSDLPIREDVLVLGEVGAFPAPLVRLAWALWAQRRWHVARASLLTHPTGADFIARELWPGLAHLARDLGDVALTRDRVDVEIARGPDGEPLPHEVDGETSAAWNRVRWSFYRRHVDEAGERRIIFALLGGRQRASTALAATMFTLLARPMDLLVDVRLSHPEVEPHTADPIFFHPGQGGDIGDEYHAGRRVRASEVGVHLIEIPMVRVSDLAPRHLDLDAVLRVVTGRIAESACPSLLVDLVQLRATWGDHDLELSPDRLLLLGALAAARIRDPSADGGWLKNRDLGRLRDIARRMDAAARVPLNLRTRELRALVEEKPLTNWEGGSLSRLRAGLVRHLGDWFVRHPVLGRELIVPVLRRTSDGCEQRLLLSADRVAFRESR